MTMTSERRRIGDRACCRRCGQDIEWRGRAAGWGDRGGNRECVAWKARDGEIQQPPKGAKHAPAH